MLDKLNDIRIGAAAIAADPFAGEKLTTTKPYVERTTPEHSIWIRQPEPGYDANWWIYRSPGPAPVGRIVVGLLLIAFVVMAVW